MVRIDNTSKHTIQMEVGTLQPGEHLTIYDEEWDEIKTNRVITHWVRKGTLVVTHDELEAPEDVELPEVSKRGGIFSWQSD